MDLADELIVIADGKIRDQGPKDELLPRLLGEFNENCTLRREVVTK